MSAVKALAFAAALAALEKQEAAKPRDPALKFEIARLHWCHKSRGVAFENWRWLARFAPASDEASRARELMQKASEHEENAVSRELSCGADGIPREPEKK